MAETHAEPPKSPSYHHYPISSWLGIKKEYITGHGSLTYLCVKWHMNEYTVRAKSQEEGWGKARAKWAERAEERIEQVLEPEEPPQNPSPGREVGNGTETVVEQIRVIDKMLASTTEPGEIVKLADAKAKLWGLLYPKPGVKRPSRRTYSPPDSDPVPTPNPAPVPVQNQNPV